MLTAGMMSAVAVLALPSIDDPALQQALARFETDFNRAGAKPDQRIAAVLAVCRHKHEAVVKALAPSLGRAPIPVRIVIARELGQFLAVPGAPEALLAALRNGANGGNKFAAVRIVLLRSLGDHRFKEAAAHVDRSIGDRNAWVSKAAIEASGKIRDRSSIEVLISQLKRIEGPRGESLLSASPLAEALREVALIPGLGEDASAKPPSEREALRDPLLAALRAITRQPLTAAKDWESWWKANKASFKVGE
jgi:HEAT repeat protein